MPDTDFEQRLRRAMRELTPEFDDVAVKPLDRARTRRRRWPVVMSVGAVAAAAVAVLVAVLPGDDPDPTPPAGGAPSTPLSSAATAACTTLQARVSGLRPDGARRAVIDLRLTPPAACTLRVMPTVYVDLRGVAHLRFRPVAGSQRRLPIAIRPGRSAVFQLRFDRVGSAGTRAADWQLTVRVGSGPTARTSVRFPARPGYFPSGIQLVGAQGG